MHVSSSSDAGGAAHVGGASVSGELVRVLRAAQVQQVLRAGPTEVTVVATLDGATVVAAGRLDALPPDDDAVVSALRSAHDVKQVMRNDVYSKWVLALGGGLGRASVELVHPASEHDVRKYTAQGRVVLGETADEYACVVQPYVRALPADRLAWVRNLVDGKAERERVLLYDADFVLAADFSWNDLSDVRSLHCVAFAAGRHASLTSMRDLRGEHAPLLRRLRDVCVRVIGERFGVAPELVRAYLHYPPSFYHLHVHFRHVAFADQSTAVCRAHALDDVISTLEAAPAYYARATLSSVWSAEHPVAREIVARRAQPAPAAAGPRDVWRSPLLHAATIAVLAAMLVAKQYR